MQSYETLLITKPTLDVEALEGLKKKVNVAIAKNGGKLVNTDDWGTKRLAYEIKKFREGTYILFEFGAAGDTVRKLEDYLNLQADVIRYMTTKKLKPNSRAKVAPGKPWTPTAPTATTVTPAASVAKTVSAIVEKKVTDVEKKVTEPDTSVAEEDSVEEREVPTESSDV